VQRKVCRGGAYSVEVYQLLLVVKHATAPGASRKRPAEEDPALDPVRPRYDIPDTWTCPCGAELQQRISRSEKNPNRPYFKCETCPKGFVWADEVNSPPGATTTYTAPSTQGGGMPAYNQNPFQAQPAYSGVDQAGPASQGLGQPVNCPCGLECFRRISNTPRNPGRAFYKCPKDDVRPGSMHLPSAMPVPLLPHRC
jgi:hypothetical protein